MLTRGKSGQRGDSWADGTIINAADSGGKHPRYASMNMLRINTEVGEEDEREYVRDPETPTVSSARQLPPDLTSVATSPIRHLPSASSFTFTPGPTGEVFVYRPVIAMEVVRPHRGKHLRMINHYNSAINDPGNTGHLTDYVMYL